MSEPDEAMVEAVASAVDLCVDGWNGEPWSMAQEVARAALSVPVVRDALARDAQVREIVARMRGLQAAARPIMRPPLAEIAANDIAALYPSPGDGWGVWGEDDIPARLISEEQRWAVYEQSDKTEGRGPMIRRPALFDCEQDAWDDINTEGGVMGCGPHILGHGDVPTWQAYKQMRRYAGDYDVRPVIVCDGWVWTQDKQL